MGRWCLWVRVTCGVIAVLMLLSGCFSYLTVDSAPVGSTVRVRVPLESAATNRNVAPQSLAIEGQLLEVGDTIVLSVLRRESIGAYRDFTIDEEYRVATDQIISLELREPDNVKSVGLGVIIALGTTFLALELLDLGGDDQGGGPGNGNGTTSFRIPIGQ